jgi:hypothetical protein
MEPQQRLDGRQPAHQLLHQIGLHLAVEQVLFGFLRQHRALVEADVALLQQLGGHDQLLAGRRAQAKAPPAAQLELAHLPARVEADHHLFAPFVEHVEHHLRGGRPGVRQHGDLAVGRDGALELLGDGRGGPRRNVDGVEREVRRLAQLEAAAGERGARAEDGKASLHREGLR